jgi:DNA-binding NarL/FixJ family response regulator
MVSTYEQTEMGKRCTRVLVVEDHQVLREALIFLLESDGDVVVSDTAGTAEEALLKVHQDLDLVVLDLSLPGRDGFWLTTKLKEERPGLPILVLTMHEQLNYVLKALESGVDGYITKWAGQKELRDAIQAVTTNGSYLHPRIAPLVVDALRCRKKSRELSFSEREREIARCLVKGLSNAEIARRLLRSISTVKSDLRSLYSKLEVSCRTEAVAAVVQNRTAFMRDRTDKGA